MQLQGRGKTVVDMVEKLEAFTRKLELFDLDLSSGRLLHFSTLRHLAWILSRHGAPPHHHNRSTNEYSIRCAFNWPPSGIEADASTSHGY